MLAHTIEHEIITLRSSCEIFLRIINHVIRAEYFISDFKLRHAIAHGFNHSGEINTEPAGEALRI